MILLDGKKVSEERLAKLQSEIQKVKKAPGLVVVRVGEDPASKIYVGHKIKACQKVGIHSEEIHVPDTTTEKDLLAQIDKLNARSDVHGILVQLPLPKQMNVSRVIERVNPLKDVDGFHPVNLGRLVAREEAIVPCTPLGIMELLAAYKISVEGKIATVIGRSRIVGRPMSLLLDHAGATVTTINKATKNPREIMSRADILVAAAGSCHLVKKEDVKQGAVVVDVGMHRSSDGKLCGDVDFENVKDKCSAITPVPGGVGPMTICGLLENTWLAFQKQI